MGTNALLSNVSSLLLLVNLVLDDAALLGGSSATNGGSVAVEVAGNLLERGVLGLDVEEVDNDEFHSEPDAVDDVVLPADVVEGNGVDVGVEEQSEVNASEHVAHGLGADGVGQNFDGVTDEKTRPGDVVERVVEEDHEDDGAAVGLDLSDFESLGEDGPDHKGHAHAGGGDEEERATTDFVDEEAHGGSDDAIPDVEDTVDLELHVGILDANGVENTGDVVRDETVAGPLGEETSRDQDDEPVSVALGPEDFEPASLFQLLLNSDGLLDFLEFQLNQFVVGIALSVNMSEDGKCLLVLALGHVPTGRLGDEPDGADLDKRGQSLDDGGNTPSPLAVDSVGAVCEPGGDNGSDIPAFG